MFKDEIRQALQALAHVSALLIKLGKRFDEMNEGPSEQFERAFFNGENLTGLTGELSGQRFAPSEDLQLNKNVKSLVLKFTNKEIKEMPRLKDCKIRFKKNSYEIRYRKYGYNKSFSGKTLELAKAKAKEWLSLLNDEFCNKEYFKIVKAEGDDFKGKKTRFSTFAISYMQNVKKPRIKPETYYSYDKTFRKHILKRYGNYTLGEITPIMIQAHLSSLNQKTPRGCEDVKMLLNNIFKYAVDNSLIQRNPVNAVYIPKHERTTGTALTLSEEKKFIEDIKGHTLELVFVLALYTGARRCELASAEIDVEKNTITFKNGKLKHYQKNLYRTLPIFPKLKPFIPRLIAENWKPLVTEHRLSVFSDIIPGHTLKDLRHTFTTRAKECKINDEIVSVWTAHSLKSITARVYTHFSIDFMQEEAKKLVY